MSWGQEFIYDLNLVVAVAGECELIEYVEEILVISGRLKGVGTASVYKKRLKRFTFLFLSKCVFGKTFWERDV